VHVETLNCVASQEALEGFLCLVRAVCPQRTSQPVPSIREAFLVSIRVLHDQPFKRRRVAVDDAEADRPAVVLREQPVAGETLGAEELGGYLG
jgi:hypothetical protein